MIAKGRAVLMEEGAVPALRKTLPLATVVTPIAEAEETGQAN